MKLIVNIEIDGKLMPAGKITGEGASDARFQYSDAYRADPGIPVSVSLPLQEAPFSAERTAAFFEGLLPEGFTRRMVAQRMGKEEGDYLSLLHGLGQECPGALSFTEEGEAPDAASYEKLSDRELRELATEGAEKAAELMTVSHLSLSGASGKTGLYSDPSDGAFYLPHGGAPSSYIVKQSHVRLDSIVTNERLSLLTAARCGLVTSESLIRNTGGEGEHTVLFATKRYDRVPGQNAEISGLKRPCRLHQEDFAQAMGIPASAKYEKAPGGHFKGMFEVIRKVSSDPEEDQRKLWDIIVFDFLIGNTDAHIKNFSLLYGRDLKEIRLAPAYDIVSTAIYAQCRQDMAFSIGGASSFHDLDRDAFRKGALEAGLPEEMAMSRFDDMKARFGDALHESARQLLKEGVPKAREIEERILRTRGYR